MKQFLTISKNILFYLPRCVRDSIIPLMHKVYLLSLQVCFRALLGVIAELIFVCLVLYT